MAAREIECDAEITCQSDNFHRSDIQDIFFSSSHRTVVEHSSSISSKKRPAGIRTCGCRAQRLQRAQRTSDIPANFVERHFFLLLYISAPFVAHIAKSGKENPFYLGNLRRLHEGMPIRLGASASSSGKGKEKDADGDTPMTDMAVIPYVDKDGKWSKAGPPIQVPKNFLTENQIRLLEACHNDIIQAQAVNMERRVIYILERRFNTLIREMNQAYTVFK